MFRIMLVYGAIAGVTIIAVMAAGVYLNGGEFSDSGQLQGYLSMIVVLSLIFVGVKRYRDQSLGGIIKFWPALKLGLGIAIVASFFYTISWEVFLAVSGIDFAGQYIEALRAGYIEDGLTGDALDAKLQPTVDLMASYNNPLIRMPMTFFLEPLPVAVVVALISAALLRNPKVFPAKA